MFSANQKVHFIYSSINWNKNKSDHLRCQSTDILSFHLPQIAKSDQIMKYPGEVLPV
jgi:hypothetical protein